MDHLIIGNLIGNAVLLGMLGWFIKRWMDETRDQLKTHCDLDREDHGDIYDKLHEHETRISRVEGRMK